ncbi:MAG: hypothetical protein EHM79_09955 [Geobacter sp.]|nr:MAG: hypothetical protein EHM79_09955 [Geobacter sp.]
MPPSKETFIERIKSLDKSLKIESVKDRPLSEREHNEVARLLRNGLAVVGFATLEDFMKKKSSEIMIEIGNSAVQFTALPEKLRYASTFEAISALNYQMSYLPKEDKILYIQEHSLKISSTATSNFELTPHAFYHDQANIKDETIKKMLKCFGIENPWGQMSMLSSRLGLTALPLEVSFQNASKRRHKAAHVSNADTPQTDIQQYVAEAIAIALTFDCLSSKALALIKLNDCQFLSGTKVLSASDIKFRTIKKIDGKWKEYTEGNSRAYRINNNIGLLLPDAHSRASLNNETLVVFDEYNKVNDWHCY